MIDPVKLGLSVRQFMGEEVLVLCPFHKDKKPSASFNLRLGLFNCFSCAAAGGADYVACQTGGRVVHVPDSQTISRRKIVDVESWRWVLDHPLVDQDNPYLLDRGIDPSVAQRFNVREVGIGVAVVLTDLHGNSCGVQIRKYAGYPRYLTLGVKPKLWPMHKLNSYRDLWVTEGVFGVMNAASYGVNAVAVLGAKSASGAAKFLKGRSPKVVFDADLPGYLGAAHLMTETGAKVLIPGRPADEVMWDPFGWQGQMTMSISSLRSSLSEELLKEFDNEWRKTIERKRKGKSAAGARRGTGI